jgi:hypothetical protein
MKPSKNRHDACQDPDSTIVVVVLQFVSLYEQSQKHYTEEAQHNYNNGPGCPPASRNRKVVPTAISNVRHTQNQLQYILSVRGEWVQRHRHVDISIPLHPMSIRCAHSYCRRDEFHGDGDTLYKEPSAGLGPDDARG